MNGQNLIPSHRSSNYAFHKPRERSPHLGRLTRSLEAVENNTDPHKRAQRRSDGSSSSSASRIVYRPSIRKRSPRYRVRRGNGYGMEVLGEGEHLRNAPALVIVYSSSSRPMRSRSSTSGVISLSDPKSLTRSRSSWTRHLLDRMRSLIRSVCAEHLSAWPISIVSHRSSILVPASSAKAAITVQTHEPGSLRVSSFDGMDRGHS